MVGSIYGRLTVIGWKGILNKNSIWICRCKCGNECDVYGCHLKTGATTSCGCFAKETISKISRTHGMSGENGHPLYKIWKAMIQRCYNKNVIGFSNYGGRGIIVCERWRNSFPNFLQDMGNRPSENYSLERIDNKSNYCPENCKWATRLEQANNKRNNVWCYYKGEYKTISQWGRILGFNPKDLYAKIASGVSLEDALSKGSATRKLSISHPAMVGPR